MNSQLIADAVGRSRGEEDAMAWDRLYAFWFRRLVYTQIWEDPVADLAALRLAVGSTIVTIASGGCNALSYLVAQPAQVYAVDLNQAHLALLKLKLAGRGQAGIELEGMEGEVDRGRRADAFERGIEAGQPDRAPGADDVGDEIDLQGVIHGRHGRR